MNKTERRGIVTFSVGDYPYDESKEQLTEYAKRCNADYINYNVEGWYGLKPHWAKFLVMYQALEQWDRVLYADIDALFNGKNAPDIFDLVPEDSLGMFQEGLYCDRAIALARALEVSRLKPTRPIENHEYFNSGVMLASRRHRELFLWPDTKENENNYYEQSLINARIAAYNIKMFPLSWKFNRMSALDGFTGSERFAAHVVHYAGSNDKPAVKADMQRTIQKWNSKADPRTWILVDVNGGLGDVVYAEPVLRYMIETIYRGTNTIFLINTAFPRVFKHFSVYPNVTIFEGKCKIEPHPELFDKQDRFVSTAPEMEMRIGVNEVRYDPRYQCMARLNTHPSGSDVFRVLCPYYAVHNLDHIMLSTLRQPIPAQAKRVHLEVTADDQLEMNLAISGYVETTPQDFTGNLRKKKGVAVHAGSGWQSKTFPVAWWNELLEALAHNGFHPILFGKNPNVLPITNPAEGIDLRNRLSLGGMFAVIQACPYLVTNESSPVCIGGAFDNYIALIAGPKPPELVLPFRHGTPLWRAHGFFDKLGLDTLRLSPTNPDGAMINRIPVDTAECAPAVSEVIEWLKRE